MTAKEALREYVDGLTEDDAADLLQWIEGREGLVDDFSQDDLARMAAGREDAAAGRVRSHAGVMADARSWMEDRVRTSSLTAEQIERVKRSLAQLDGGQGVDQGAVETLFDVKD